MTYIKNSFGVYVASKANFQVMEKAEWTQAKSGNLRAAQKIVAQVWQESDTELDDLREDAIQMKKAFDKMWDEGFFDKK